MSQNDNGEQLMLTIKQICKFINVSRTTLRSMIITGRFPAATKIIGRKGKRWSKYIVETWTTGGDIPTGPGRPRGK